MGPVRDLVELHVAVLVGEVGELLGHDGLHADLVRVVLRHRLRVVRPVERHPVRVRAGPRVVPSDDQVRGAVVASDERVPDRLARPCEAHGQRHQREQRVRRVVVVLHQDLVGLHAQRGGHVLGPGDADGRMDEERPADRLQCALGELLVDAVHGVTRLERNDGGVAHRDETLAQLRGREAQGAVQPVARQVEYARAAGEVVARPALGLDDERVRAVPAAEHRPHLAQDVRRVHLVHLEHGQDGALLVRQRDLARVPPQDLLTTGEGERDREELAALEAHLVEDRLVLLVRHEPVERRERAHRQHLQVVLGAQGERHYGKVLRPVEQLGALIGVVDDEIDETPAERRDERALPVAGVS